ncbi:protein kinase C and casein kinase substrate in neurons protein 2-like [Oopsacas minuta]|uniref:Protein kinase C and casein kinase substrate in neurons protein 2-like n=1 Tax=Oopsacas minuta TaxID=111878 RepID=A0AAV7JDT7_9METZ|nr:protein kinase C and casein kinase substrate in neurons protein 2-like [Oopsacas minuta]
MKEGKRMCIDFEEFLHQRAVIEERYARDMLALAKKPGAKDEIGTLKDSWLKMKEDTENIAQYHMLLANKLRNELELKVREFHIRQREERKKAEDTVKRAQAHKRRCFDNHNRAKRDYETKCREADKAEELALTHQGTKDSEKVNNKHRRAKESSEAADHQYKETVVVLEEARVHWEREYELCCVKFQALEEERVDFLRNIIWIFTNILSQACVHVDERMEQIRKVLEVCDIEKDIDEFVRNYRTSSDHPSEIVYQNFYQPKQNSNSKNIPIPHKSSDKRPLPALPPQNSAIATIQSQESQDNYSSPDEVILQANPSDHYDSLSDKKKVSVLYDYVSQGQQELNLKVGDKVVVIYEEDELWWYGQDMIGNQGMFPSTFVSESV